MAGEPTSRKRVALGVAGAVAGALLLVGAFLLWDGDDEPSGPVASTTGGNPFRAPVALSSENGVLEVTLRAHQASADLDTVDEPVENFLLFGYELEQGSASNGEPSSEGSYPGPTLKVDPGDRLIVHIANEMAGLTIDDFLDPALTPAGEDVSTYPDLMLDPPYNLHTHGLHVSPKGNSDNVLLNIPAGFTNTYEYEIPEDHTTGMWWYHSHLHQLTSPHTYMGLTGLLQIGRADGDIPLVTDNDIPVRNMALQYNFVFDRAGNGRQLNNPNWPQYVSTLDEPEGDELAQGTYEPSLAPVNFTGAAEGTSFVTNWWTGELSVHNNRGAYQSIPQNMQRFSTEDSAPTGTVATAPSSTSDTTGETVTTVIEPDYDVPDHERDVQFTVNGQFQPVIESKAGQTEIWVLANISDFAYTNVQLTETATGDHPKIAIVAQDGEAYPQVQYPDTNDGTTLLIPPASRYAIAVTIPEEGDLVLEMPPIPDNDTTLSNEAILYTNDGTDNTPGVLGTVEIPPESYSWNDGFFAWPTQELVTANGGAGDGETTEFAAGQDLDAYNTYEDLSDDTPAVERTLTISGGFDNNWADEDDPKSFVYEFDNNTFPYIPLLQPRIDTVEQWSVVNNNNDSHPIHVHINDFQITQFVDPLGDEGGDTGPWEWAQDNVDIPAPPTDSSQNVTDPSSVTFRSHYTDYVGTFVIHCHRLNHEDNGLMALVNIIPNVSPFAVAQNGAPGDPSRVTVYDQEGNEVLAEVVPFPDYEGLPSVTIGDIDGDSVYDLIAAQGEGGRPEVVVYSGASVDGSAPFETELARFDAFPDDYDGGVTLAADDIDGNGFADNLVVGSGPGRETEVKVFESGLPDEIGDAPEVFASISPYPGEENGVSVATGLLEAASGRNSIVTVPGPGTETEVKVYRFDLYEKNDAFDDRTTDVATPDPSDPRDGATTTTSDDDRRDASGTDSSGASAGRPRTTGEPASDNNLTRRVAAFGALLIRDVFAVGTGREPVLVDSFKPYGDGYEGGASVATGWVAGDLGGAQSVVLGQLDASGTVKVYSTGNALDGQPEDYIYTPGTHDTHLAFEQIASFEPFEDSPGGVRVATTSTSFGADVLVAGGPEGAGRVLRFELGRASSTDTTLTATQVAEAVGAISRATWLGGD